MFLSNFVKIVFIEISFVLFDLRNMVFLEK